MRPFNSSGAFRPSELEGGLRRLALRSAGVTLLSQAVVFSIQMIATVVLARLLTPADFGLVTMVTTFSLLLMSFGQNGYVEAVLQRVSIDHFLASNLFWINVVVGLILTIGFAGAGSLLTKFYHEPRVAHVAIGMSLTIFITSTSVLHLALLKRAMEFATVSVIDILARILSVSVSILLAWAGWGYWALVAGYVTQAMITSLAAWSQCRWIPALPQQVPGTGSVAHFAINVYGRFSVNHFARNTDNLLVGWRFGPSSLGFYKKAYDLFVLPANQLLSPVSDVVLSTLSRLDHKSAQYQRYFLTGLSIVAFVGMAVGADLTIVGKDLIRVLLGPRWGESGRIFTFFGPGIGIMLIYYAHGWIHLSIGRADRYLRWTLVEVAVTILLFVAALPWGPVGIAATWTASFWILTVPAYWYAGKPIRFGILPILGAIWKYALASALAGAASAWLASLIHPFVAVPGVAGAMSRIVADSLVFLGLYIGAVFLLHGSWEPLRQVSRVMMEMIPWGEFSRSARRSKVLAGPYRPQEVSMPALGSPDRLSEDAE